MLFKTFKIILISQARYLNQLFPYLKRRYVLEALNVINDIQEPYYQAMAKVNLARRFPESDLFEAAQVATHNLEPLSYNISNALKETTRDFATQKRFGGLGYTIGSKLRDILSSTCEGRVHRIELLSTLAIDMPELLPSIIKLAEQLDSTSGDGPLSTQFINVPNMPPPLREAVKIVESESGSNGIFRRDTLIALSSSLYPCESIGK